MNSRRFEGHWIIGRQGSGKTQLLQHMIAKDLSLVEKGEATVIVLDPTGAQKGQLIDNVITLKTFAPRQPLDGRLIYIDPTDLEYTTPINLLSLGETDSEAALNAAFEMYNSIISGIFGTPLTTLQESVFHYVIQLATNIPGATIRTVRDIIRSGPGPYREYLAACRPDVQDFFEFDFNADSAKRSKGEILPKLNLIFRNPTFLCLFEHAETKIDLFTEMNSAKVIVINADRFQLGPVKEAYGRYFLALLTLAGIRRATLPREKRLPCFVYIDECDEFIKNDPNVSTILTKLRQQNIGLIFGNQFVGQIEDAKVRSSLFTTSIKYVSANKESAVALAGDMNTTPEFLMNRQPGNFAAHILGTTHTAIDITVPYHVMEDMPHMSAEEFAQVRERIRERYCVPVRLPEEPTQHRRSDESPPESTDDIRPAQSW
jgi:hypothetical protein